MEGGVELSMEYVELLGGLDEKSMRTRGLDFVRNP